jgi:hypothetical protein
LVKKKPATYTGIPALQHTIVHAIANKQASLPEALMREHAKVTLNYAKVFSETDLV